MARTTAQEQQEIIERWNAGRLERIRQPAAATEETPAKRRKKKKK